MRMTKWSRRITPRPGANGEPSKPAAESTLGQSISKAANAAAGDGSHRKEVADGKSIGG